MKSVNKLVLLLTLTMIMVANTGCLSLLSYNASKREIMEEAIVASGNQKAVDLLLSGVKPERAFKAVQLDNNGVGLGLDVSNVDALLKHPVRQTLAGAGDVGLAWGAKELIDYLGSSTGSSGNNLTVNVSDSQDTSISVSGDAITDTTTTDSHDGHGDNR